MSNATLVKPPAKPGEVLRPESNGDGYQIFGTVNIRILKARVSLWSVSTVPNLPVFQPVRRAIQKRDTDGIVLVHSEQCIGCQACLAACPFGVPQFDSKGIMQKCDLCVNERLADCNVQEITVHLASLPVLPVPSVLG